MRKTTEQERRMFINELQYKWQEKFRSSQYWHDKQERELIEELDNYWKSPFTCQGAQSTPNIAKGS